MRTLITNGTIVTAGELVPRRHPRRQRAIDANRRQPRPASGLTADETIDAKGKYVIPGAIDVHTHMELPFGGTFAKDTFETGTRAAASRGHDNDRGTSPSRAGARASAKALTRGTRRPKATPPSTTGST